MTEKFCYFFAMLGRNYVFLPDSVIVIEVVKVYKFLPDSMSIAVVLRIVVLSDYLFS